MSCYYYNFNPFTPLSACIYSMFSLYFWYNLSQVQPIHPRYIIDSLTFSVFARWMPGLLYSYFWIPSETLLGPQMSTIEMVLLAETSNSHAVTSGELLQGQESKWAQEGCTNVGMQAPHIALGLGKEQRLTQKLGETLFSSVAVRLEVKISINNAFRRPKYPPTVKTRKRPKSRVWSYHTKTPHKC